MKTLLVQSFVMAAAVSVTVCAADNAALPIPWIMSSWALVGLTIAVRGRSRALRILSLNCAAIAVIVGLADLSLWPAARRADDSNHRLESSQHYVVHHQTFGYGAYGPTRRDVRLLDGDRVVYDVTYTIGADGLRTTPPERASPPDGTFVAFGGSFTFGEGLSDNATMPWRVAELTGRRWRVLNLGFHGWGAQQMLAALDAGLVAGMVSGARTEGLYQTAFFHVARTAGRVAWAAGTPRYVLAPDGTVARRGLYPKELAGPFPWLRPFDRWLLWRRLMGPARPPGDEAVALFTAVVVSARDEFERTLPGGRFRVLYWDTAAPWFDGPLVAALRSRGLDVTRASQLLEIGDPLMHIDRTDAHPSARADDLVACWAVQAAGLNSPG